MIPKLRVLDSSYLLKIIQAKHRDLQSPWRGKEIPNASVKYFGLRLGQELRLEVVDIANQMLTRHSPLAPYGQVVIRGLFSFINEVGFSSQ